MPGLGTNINGPLFVGTRPQNAATTPAVSDYWPVQCNVRGTVFANGTLTVSGTAYVPIGSVIIDVTEDTLVAWNAGSAVATVGTAAADTSFAASTTVTTTGRARPTFSATNLINMGSVVAPGALVYSVAPSVSCSAGTTVFNIEYAPQVNQYVGNT